MEIVQSLIGLVIFAGIVYAGYKYLYVPKHGEIKFPWTKK